MKIRMLPSLLITLLFVIGSSYAAVEQCPTSQHVKALYASNNALPADGMMPYPVDMTDPTCELNYDDSGNPIPGTGLQFVVTRIAISDRGDPTKYVGFVIFSDGNCTLTSDQAVTHAKSIVAAMPLGKNKNIDYYNFYIGDGDDGTPYYFDVCVYEGSFNVPVGTANTNMDNIAVSPGNPLVMTDLSPKIGIMLTHDVKKKMRSMYNRRNAQ